MQAQVGDEIIVDGLRTGDLPREGEIIAIKERGGTCLYEVRWDDGHESTFCPGETAHVIHLRVGALSARVGNADPAISEQRAYFAAWVARRAPDEPITFVETHVSILALGTERVWKLKKAVRFPFVDLSTAARRRRNAEREVALNRRFAPDVYFGAIPLDDARGNTLDTVVEMRRMPDGRRLAVLAEQQDPTACVDRIARDIAGFHREAPTGPEIDRAGRPETLAGLWSTNVDEMRPFCATVIDASVLDQVARDAERYLAGRTPLLEQRIADGCIRDGHGDLLADDVFCLDDGPRFLDCLEFDDTLRFGDVVGDVAFLAMDLERLGRRDLAQRLLAEYRRRSDGDWPASLADLYVAYRALVRAKIACLRVGTDPSAPETARRLLSIAAAHLAQARVHLVLIGGPPATGKTTLSHALARRTGWRALHSDEIRKQLAGLRPTDSAADALDAGLYRAASTARTYDAMLASARQWLGRGESVILDASWSDPERRTLAARVAGETSSVLSSFELTLPDETADRRAAARATRHDDASDAGPAIAAALRSRFADWPQAQIVDATPPADLVAEDVQARVDSAH